MSKADHPFHIWIKRNGLKLGYVSAKLGVHSRTLGRYLKSGSAPMVFRYAVSAYTDGDVGIDAWADPGETGGAA